MHAQHPLPVSTLRKRKADARPAVIATVLASLLALSVAGCGGGSAPALTTAADSGNVVESGFVPRSGYALVPIGTQADASKVVVQPDGNILVGGRMCTGDWSFALIMARFQSTGALDPSFGAQGTLRATAGSDGPTVLALQADAKILVGAGAFLLARYHRDGTLDTSFGGTGFADNPDGASARHLIVQPDGKILVVASTWNNHYLYRYLANGALDTTFGTQGRIVDNAPIGAIALQADGQLLVVQNYGAVAVVRRYDRQGNLDRRFGDDGDARLASGATPIEFLASLPNGSILAAGLSGGINATPANIVLFRRASTGQAESSFGDAGSVTLVVKDFRGTAKMVLQTDGKLLIAGTNAIGNDGSTAFQILRVTASGSFDPTWGNNGSVITDVTFQSADVVYAAAVQADGKVIVAGASNAALAVARYTSDGSLDK